MIDNRVSRRTFDSPYANKGEIITCEQGHPVAVVARDINSGDPQLPGYLDWPFQPEQPPGSRPEDCRCIHCGAMFFLGNGILHFRDGWRCAYVEAVEQHLIATAKQRQALITGEPAGGNAPLRRMLDTEAFAICKDGYGPIAIILNGKATADAIAAIMGEADPNAVYSVSQAPVWAQIDHLREHQS